MVGWLFRTFVLKMHSNLDYREPNELPIVKLYKSAEENTEKVLHIYFLRLLLTTTVHMYEWKFKKKKNQQKKKLWAKWMMLHKHLPLKTKWAESWQSQTTEKNKWINQIENNERKKSNECEPVKCCRWSLHLSIGWVILITYMQKSSFIMTVTRSLSLPLNVLMAECVVFKVEREKKPRSHTFDSKLIWQFFESETEIHNKSSMWIGFYECHLWHQNVVVATPK